ncbi:MAG TPA: hypothetical protein PLO59_09130, partial [Bacteroidia bacterium]|nr:hypothetical protein [Bacteroidia bacterium]
MAFADSCSLIIDKYFLNSYEPTYTKAIVENQCVFNFKIDSRVTATFHYNNQTIPLIISPNSVIEIFVGTDSLYNSIRLHENEKHNNQFLLYFNKQFKNDFADSLIFETMLSNKADVFEMKAFKLQQNQLDFIRSIIDSLKPDDATVSYLKNRVKYLYYYKMQAFAIINANADKGLTVKPMPDLLLENVGPNLLNDELLGIDTYRKFIEYYVIYQTSKLNGFNKFTDFNISMDKKIAFANTRLTPRTKSYYVANYLNNHINEVLPATAKYNYQQLTNFDVFGYAALVETVCKNRINAKVEKTKTSVSDYRDQKIMGVDGKYFTLQDFKGKVV